MIYLNHLIRKDILANARGIVFDCDGVLIDSLDANTFYYNSIRAAFDLPEMSLEMRDYTHAHNIWESLRCIVPEDKFEAAWQMKLDYDYRQVLAHIKLEPGLRELLGWLRSAGQKMSINTSRTDNQWTWSLITMSWAAFSIRSSPPTRWRDPSRIQKACA